MDVFQSVLCVDNPPIKDPNVARDVDARYRKVAPFLDSGQPPSPALDNCAFWPVPSTGAPHNPEVDALVPVVVISTTQDPVVGAPYQAGVNLAEDLNARLLTFKAPNTPHSYGASAVSTMPRSLTPWSLNLRPTESAAKRKVKDHDAVWQVLISSRGVKDIVLACACWSNTWWRVRLRARRWHRSSP